MQKDQAGTTKMAIIIAIVAVIVASIALLAVSKMQRDRMPMMPNGEEGTAPSVSTGAGARDLGISYTQALDLYSEGYRFQFSSCSGTPGTLNVAAGTTVLLDNRDNAAHTIKVGASTYTLGAYGYRIITASTKGKQQITCDGKGAAVLNIQ